MSLLRERELRGTGGTIWGHVFENPRSGVPRGLYWSVTLECEPIIVDGEELSCSISCEWLEWRIASWKELDGMTLASSVQPDLAECSVYLWAHHPVRLHSLALTRLGGTTRFSVELAASLDLEGYDDLDGSDIPLSLSATAEFTGLIVVPDSLFPKPSTAAEASTVAEELIGLQGLQAPRWDRFRYLLEPE